jgi:hypothetical protein
VSETASVGIKDSPNAAKSAVFLSSGDTLLTDDVLDKETVFELKEVSSAGNPCEDTIPLSIEAIADGFDKPEMLLVYADCKYDPSCWSICMTVAGSRVESGHS